MWEMVGDLLRGERSPMNNQELSEAWELWCVLKYSREVCGHNRAVIRVSNVFCLATINPSTHAPAAFSLEHFQEMFQHREAEEGRMRFTKVRYPLREYLPRLMDGITARVDREGLPDRCHDCVKSGPLHVARHLKALRKKGSHHLLPAQLYVRTYCSHDYKVHAKAFVQAMRKFSLKWHALRSRMHAASTPTGIVYTMRQT